MAREKTLIDISISLEPGMLTWPGDPEYVSSSVSSVEIGDSCNVTRISLGSHTGTHVDAPSHFMQNGESVDAISLDILIGEALVVEVYADFVDDLSAVDLQGVTRLLLKTRNSELLAESGFTSTFTYLTGDAAQFLVDCGIKLVGIDYLSIDDPHSDNAHRVLLENGVVILEAVNLLDVDPGRYELICLPLKLQDIDGAPARAVLRVLS